MTIPWGDVATAYHSTGIPNIEVYMAAPKNLRVATRLSRYVAPLLATKVVQGFLKSRIRSGPPGPTDAERARGASLLWGEASDDAGARVVSRLRTPEGYTLTALAALAIVEKVLRVRPRWDSRRRRRLTGPTSCWGWRVWNGWTSNETVWLEAPRGGSGAADGRSRRSCCSRRS